jgi:malate permease and related proteins
MSKLGLIALLFLAGVLLRHLGWLDARHGTRLLRIVATVGLPALIIGTIGRVPLVPALLALPVTAALVMLVVGMLALVSARLMRLARPAAGALVVSAMAMNLAFVFPFVFLAWGPDGLARTVAFDAGNAVMQWTLVYLLAARYGGHATNPGAILGRLLRVPPFIAILVAVPVNLLVNANADASSNATAFLDALRVAGQVLTLLVVPAMGLLFDPRRIATAPVVVAVVLRCGAGAAAGAVLALVSGIDARNAAVVIVGSAAPVAFSSVVMAEREGLDVGLAVAAASLSALAALVVIPGLMALTGPW